MLRRRKESELSLSACRLCADGQPLRGYPSQNDVKFKRTHAAKVFVSLFSKGSGVWGGAPHRFPLHIKFHSPHCTMFFCFMQEFLFNFAKQLAFVYLP